MTTPTKAKSTKNTKIQLGDGGAPEVFTTIDEITSFGAPQVKQGSIEVTNCDSDAVERIGDGLADGGSVVYEMNFVGSSNTQQQLRTLAGSGTTRNIRHIYNDHATTPTTITFPAVIENFDGPKGAVKEALKATCTVTVAGKPTVNQYAP